MRTDGMIPIIAIVGRTNSGKTTLIEQLIPALARRGCRVATIKHHHHGDFEADHPGKDSWRHAQAGAVATALAGTHRLAVFQRVETDLTPDQIARLFVVAPDLVLTEGYRIRCSPRWRSFDRPRAPSHSAGRRSSSSRS
jgi:molybdopterin-guanine dinucleotide biosynthesis protein B